MESVKGKISKFRMYENQLPEVNDLVMARVDRLDNDVCVLVNLLEYGNIEAIVLLSDIIKRRMKSVTQHLRPGQQVVLQVLRVDKEKRYIDLSKALVQEADQKQCYAWFNKSKTVHSILALVSRSSGTKKNKKNNTEGADANEDEKEEQSQKEEEGQDESVENHGSMWSFEELYQKIGWPLYRMAAELKEGGHALDLMEMIAAGQSEDVLDKLFKDVETEEGKDYDADRIQSMKDLHQKIKSLLINKIKFRLTAKSLKIQADIQVTCFAPAGISGIKPALRAAERSYTEESEDKEEEVKSAIQGGVVASTSSAGKKKIQVQLVRSPEYVLIVNCKDSDKGSEILNRAIQACQMEVKKYGGDCVITAAPRVV